MAELTYFGWAPCFYTPSDQIAWSWYVYSRLAKRWASPDICCDKTSPITLQYCKPTIQKLDSAFLLIVSDKINGPPLLAYLIPGQYSHKIHSNVFTHSIQYIYRQSAIYITCHLNFHLPTRAILHGSYSFSCFFLFFYRTQN